MSARGVEEQLACQAYLHLAVTCSRGVARAPDGHPKGPRAHQERDLPGNAPRRRDAFLCQQILLGAECGMLSCPISALSSKRWHGRMEAGSVERGGPPGEGLGSSLELNQGYQRPSILRWSRDPLHEPYPQSLPVLTLGTSVEKIASSRAILMRGWFENRYAT